MFNEDRRQEIENRQTDTTLNMEVPQHTIFKSPQHVQDN